MEWNGRRGQERKRLEGKGEDGRGTAGADWIGQEWKGEERQERIGEERSGEERKRLEGKGTERNGRRGLERKGVDRQEGTGKERTGQEWRGTAGGERSERAEAMRREFVEVVERFRSGRATYAEFARVTREKWVAMARYLMRHWRVPEWVDVDGRGPGPPVGRLAGRVGLSSPPAAPGTSRPTWSITRSTRPRSGCTSSGGRSSTVTRTRTPAISTSRSARSVAGGRTATGRCGR